ncbi:Diadenosine polyphosphate hydrolase, proteins of the histidine triad (HIT) family [Pseudoloma neurophilia]|uniref:Diadenosine polyphosphate hydrolase, proteins of the histidine triad (HIT) family n=1 Tax=Pseudoloma neurophilia TaxID=146866 RepID=A0A0R0LTA5_9MICR|nr:Diadenosine polyphosphate hydrolase, proteins of the histidine triad (HIT) family [Pseudoloma neurophilia]
MKFSESIDIPNEQIVVETVHSFVFVNLRPFLKYHLLISPKRIVKQLVNLSKEELNDLFETVQKCEKAFAFYTTHFTITVQDGEFAGQTVSHVHVHLIPRLKEDISVNNEIYKEGSLETNIDDEGKIRKNRSLEEMKKESEFLRTKFSEIFK